MSKTRGRKWYKYSPEFKQAAVDRFIAGESATALAKELGMRKKFLYTWRDDGFGSNASGKPKRESVVDEDPKDKQIAKLEQQVAELHRLLCILFECPGPRVSRREHPVP